MMSMREIFYGPDERVWFKYPGFISRTFMQDEEIPLLPHQGEEEEEEETVETMHFQMNLCCENCVRKVTKKIKDMDDVKTVTCNQWDKKVSITSSVDPERMLQRLQKIKKRTIFWPRD